MAVTNLKFPKKNSFLPIDLKVCLDTSFNIRNNILKFQNDTITRTGIRNPGSTLKFYSVGFLLSRRHDILLIKRTYPIEYYIHRLVLQNIYSSKFSFVNLNIKIFAILVLDTILTTIYLHIIEYIFLFTIIVIKICRYRKAVL
jgi:hypothetical protein